MELPTKRNTERTKASGSRTTTNRSGGRVREGNSARRQGQRDLSARTRFHETVLCVHDRNGHSLNREVALKVQHGGHEKKVD